ncbi:hypothetical protein L6452_32536 [Arctium lappa]|uniref:Uncharacterized protein n=1 Tax=Arctium lappa TaxID=4217 RepID=A0ACB8Z3Z5_ARCLA|nr:hypothetical protein L6452_32536 [Arctium lappa]
MVKEGFELGEAIDLAELWGSNRRDYKTKHRFEFITYQGKECDGIRTNNNCYALSKWTRDRLRERKDLELAKGGLGYAPLRILTSKDDRREDPVGETSTRQWNSPTIGKEVDMASTKKSEAGRSDMEMDGSFKENDATFYARPVDKGKQVLADMPEEVRRDDAHESNKDHSSNKPSDNVTCMTTFAYFSAPSYDLGITLQKIQSDPRQDSKQEEDKGKCIEKGRRKRSGEKLRSSEILFMSNMSKSICRKAMQSLIGDSVVCSNVIDGWTDVLNDDEKRRSTDSPCRHFLSTKVLIDPLITNPEVSEE